MNTKTKRAKICSVQSCQKKPHAKGLCGAHYMSAKRKGHPEAEKKFERGAAKKLVASLLVARNLGQGCIEWPHYIGRQGYGRARVEGRAQSVPAYLLSKRIPKPDDGGLYDCAHSCGNRACVNPNHLSWKTPKENSADKVAHGTLLYGERVGNSKLTKSQVIRIFNDERSSSEVSKDYPVTASHIAFIKRGGSWRHLHAERVSA